MKVEVTNKNAIYIDGCRITDRNTKWGIHNILDEFQCETANLHDELKRRWASY